MTRPAPEAIEQALRGLLGVEGARVCVDGEEIAEIHIAAAPGTRAKNVARDVRSYLAAALGLDIDHKRISIAVRRAQGMQPAPTSRAGEAPRVLLRGLGVFLDETSAEAEVRLAAGEVDVTGRAEGPPSAGGSERLIAQATLAALQRMVREEVRLVLGEVMVTRMSGGEVVLVEVHVVRPRATQRLVGASPLAQDRLRPVVFATLAALNRVLAVLLPPGWMEVRVEPGAVGRWEVTDESV